MRAFHEEDDIKKSYDLRLIGKIWPFVRPHAGALYVSLGTLVLLALLGLVRPLILRSGFDTVSRAGASSGGVPAPGAETALMHAGVLLLGVIVIEQCLSFGQMFAMQIAGARAMADLRMHVFRFLHTRRLRFFDQQPVGRLVTRVTNDVDALGEMFASGALNALGDLIKLTGIVAMMLALNTKLALIAFVALPPVGLLVNWVRKRARKAFREIRTKTARLNAFLSEQVMGMSVTQAYAREASAQGEFDTINVAYRNANFQSIALDATLDATVEMVSSVCVAAIIWYVGVRPFGGEVSFGTLVAFIAYIEQFFGPIRDLSSRYTLLQSALTGAERVFLLLENSDEDAPRRTPQATQEPSPYALEFDHVSFEYKPGVLVLEDFSLSVKPGERIALVGPTGAGKSTVASILLRLYDITTGYVRVFGKDITSQARDELRRQFSVVPQDVFLFPGTIAENISLGDAIPDMERVRNVLEHLGAVELFARREQGLLSRVDERGSNFSAGERQLLAFARALYRDAPILVLDEATASVDSDTEARLQRAFALLLEHRTALIIAHRLSTIRSVDRIVVIHKGKIAEQGSHEELLARGGIYAKLYALQSGREQAHHHEISA